MYIYVIFFSLFPYITPISLGTDLQPWSILGTSIFGLILFYRNIKFYDKCSFLFLPFLMAFLLLLISFNMSSLRSFIGYTSILFYPIVFHYILKNKFDLFVSILKISVIIYFFVAFIQLFLDIDFLSFLLNRNITTESRGVVSLAPEPTFYGLICLFLILIFIILDIKGKNKYIFLLIIQIVFFAQSSMVILFVLIYIFYSLLVNFKLKQLLIVISCILIIILVINSLDLFSSNIRSLIILNQIISHPSGIITADASINDRIAAIYFSIKGFYDNFFIPNGFNSYEIYVTNEVLKQELFWFVSKNNRIMSFYGSIVYEIGIIGCLIPLVYTLIIIKSFRNKRKLLIKNFLFIHTILFTAIPLSFPLVGIYFAALIYKSNNLVDVKNNKNEEI